MQDYIFPHFEIKDKEKICILKTLEKQEILDSINFSGMEAICHVDEVGRLVGITCDSDLRKGEKYLINYNPQTIYEDSSKVGLDREYIPVIDKFNVLKSVLYRPKEQVLRLEEIPKNITIIGLGYVGLTLAIAFAKKGIKVFCFDKNKSLLKSLREKELPFFEYGLKGAFEEAFHNIIFKEINDPITTENVIVTVGTPLLENKVVNLNYLYKAIDQICESSKKQSIKNIILRSTVPVGTCSKLESYVNKKFCVKINFVMCPERTIEGKAIEELSINPQIIGTSSVSAATICFKLFGLLTENIYIANSSQFAELAKLGDNTYRDFVFSYSNFISCVAQEFQLVGSDLVRIMNMNYPRNNLAKPSPGVGGPCLSKDAYIFKEGLDNSNLKINNDFILTGRKQDDYLINYLSNLVMNHCNNINKYKVSIAGLAFKGFPETSDTRDSSTIKLVRSLNKQLSIKVYDPLITNQKFSDFELSNFNDFCTNSSVLIIMTNNKSFRSDDWDKVLKKLAKKALVIDGWGILDRFNVAVEYDLIYKRL